MKDPVLPLGTFSIRRGKTYAPPVLVVDMSLFQSTIDLIPPFLRQFVVAFEKVHVSLDEGLYILDLLGCDAAPAIVSSFALSWRVSWAQKGGFILPPECSRLSLSLQHSRKLHC